MTEAQIAAAKRALSQARVTRFQTMPPTREEWLAELDAISTDTGIPNIYRLYPAAGVKQEEDMK